MERLRQRVQVVENALELLAVRLGMTPREWNELFIKAQAKVSLETIHEIVDDLPKIKPVEVSPQNSTEVLTNLIKNIRNDGSESL